MVVSEKEVKGWVSDGIISEKQAQAILAKYGLAEKYVEISNAEEGKHLSKVALALLIIGVVVIGGGTILLMASNWQKIPALLKLVVLFGTTFSAYISGWMLKYERRTYIKLGDSLLLLGSILVGVTIFLTGQIFNVQANAHWLILLWFIAILPLGYAFDSRPILGLNIFTFAIWLAIYTMEKSSFFFFEDSSLLFFYLLFGIALYGIGQLHTMLEKYQRFKTTYQGAGLFLVLFSLYPYLFGITPMQTLEGFGNPVLRALMSAFALIGIGSIALVALKEKIRAAMHEFIVLVAAFAGATGIWTINFLRDSLITAKTTPYGFPHTTVNPSVALAIYITYTLLFFGIAIGSVSIGYYKKLASFINLGLIFFALGILTVYFDTLYKMMPTALAMIAGGILLVGVGWYLDKKRRSMLEGMKLQ